MGVTVEERRAFEQKLRDKQFELDRSLRAAATSELASALAHELNQPLSAVASYTRACQLLLERGDPSHELPSIMKKVVFEANRAGTVVVRAATVLVVGSASAWEGLAVLPAVDRGDPKSLSMTSNRTSATPASGGRALSVITTIGTPARRARLARSTVNGA